MSIDFGVAVSCPIKWEIPRTYMYMCRLDRNNGQPVAISGCPPKFWLSVSCYNLKQLHVNDVTNKLN